MPSPRDVAMANMKDQIAEADQTIAVMIEALRRGQQDDRELSDEEAVATFVAFMVKKLDPHELVAVAATAALRLARRG